MLLLSVITQAQFNTASFKPQNNTIDLVFNENINNQSSFVNYEILNKKKEIKEIAVVNNDTEKKQSKKQFKKLEPLAYEEIEEKQLVFMPLEQMKVTSGFGFRYHPVDRVYKEHNGIDLAADNSFVYSVLNGIVLDSGYTSTNGNYMIVQHSDFTTYYLHLDTFYNIKGDYVYAGDIIAVTGSTGKSTGEHLHFAVKENGIYINPIEFLNNLIETNNTLIHYDRN